MPEITLPNKWKPRDYQMPFWNYLEGGGKRAIEIAHRRWGKDDVMLHKAAVAAIERPATYWHCLPEYAQARKAIWNAVNGHTGKRRIDEAFPHEIRKRTNDQEMFIEFVNGSTWQVIGSDRYDNLVGAGVAGVSFSEWALCNPSAWGYISPMIEETDGWASFITTPRGKNHAHSMLKEFESDPTCFAEVSSILDTKAIMDDRLERIRKQNYIALFGEDLGQARFEQEYYCSFNASIMGAFYAREMANVRTEGRIDHALEAEPSLPVHTAWDIGVRDDTSIWWFQIVGRQLYILDFYTNNSAGVQHYAEIVKDKAREHGWRGGVDYVPHDARVKEWGTGKTRVEVMRELGLNPQVVPNLSKLDGINAVRETLPRCVFAKATEEVGISALENYRREWDDERKCLKAQEVHDWSSHPADAFRYLAVAWKEQAPARTVPLLNSLKPDNIERGFVAQPLKARR